MSTPLIPQEIYLIERYSSLKYYGAMRDAFEKSVRAAENALEAYMRHLPDGYRNLPQHQQRDLVWGERVLPNLRWTLESVNVGYERIAAGDLDGLGFAGNVKSAQAAIMRDYPNDWMPEPFREIQDAEDTVVSISASNINFTSICGWIAGSLSIRYSVSRGPLDLPLAWPTYIVSPKVRVKTGEPAPKTGIYLPDVDNSCPELIVAGHAAWKANVGYDPETTQRMSQADTTWTLVERIADVGGGIPGHEAGPRIADHGRVESGQPCPESGWWMTPAKQGSRRYFQEGEIMPSFGSDYGLTIWQWDTDQSAPRL